MRAGRQDVRTWTAASRAGRSLSAGRQHGTMAAVESGSLITLLLAAALIAAFWSPAEAMTGTAEGGGLRVELRSEPQRPVTGQKTVYTARIVEADGSPVVGARVLLVAGMPDGMNVTVPLHAGGEP